MKHLRLTQIGARNLKGLTFDLDLAPTTFLVGPNFAGKSARGDAIRLLLGGHLPEQGKKNDATFGLSSGSDLEVHGVLTDEFGHGYTLSRRWFLKGDSIKTEKNVPPFLEGNLIEVMLNASSWFGLTERERVDWVYTNAPVETELTRANIVEIVRGAARERLNVEEDLKIEKPEEVIEKFFRELVQKLAEREEERTEGPFNTPEYVEAATEVAAELEAAARNHHKTMGDTVAGLAMHRASDKAPPDISAIESSLKKIKEEINALRQTRATLTAAGDVARERRTRRAFLKKELADNEARVADRDLRRAKIAGLKASMADVPEVTLEEVDSLVVEERQASDAANRWSSEVGYVTQAIERNERELADISGKEVCPYCGAAGTGWKAIKTAEIDAALAGLKSKFVDLNERLSGARELQTGLMGRIRSKRGFLQQRTELVADLRTAESALNRVELAIAAVAGKNDELAAIPGEDTDLDARTFAADGALREKNEAAAKLEIEQRAALGRQHDLKRLAESEKGRDAAKIEEIVGKESASGFRGIKAKMVAEAFAPLLEAANSFCGSLLKSPISFNAQKSEIGTVRGGQWIGHKTFTGVEQLVTYAGIQAAFAKRSPVRVMVIDEMLRAQDEVFDALVVRCKAAVKDGLVDNFVGIIPGKPERYVALADPSDDSCKVVPIS